MDLFEINKAITINNYLTETVMQLEKDFLMMGINFDIEKPVSNYQQLFYFTHHLVAALNEKEPKRILNLLYRIDIAEEQIQNEMQNTTVSYSEMLSELMVKRELYKVLMRKHFSTS